MAAIYDALGNVVGDDSAPSLDQMNLALTKSNRLTPQQMERFVAPQPLASQIPGYGKPVPPAQTPPAANPLESAAGNFTQLATNFNPLMMMKSMKEAAGILTVPPVAAIKGVGESLVTSPPGTFTSGQAPAYAENVAKQFMEQNAPQTPVTQAFASAISPLVADLPAYLGHLQTGRPALTPNDVRVMGAEATRMGRQVRDIPTDFANAQSGMQKIDPITGQPTIGARFGQAERNVTQAGMQFEKSLDPVVQDIMARGGTSADILAAMAGQPLYAMRPEGSRIQNAVVPSTAATGAATYTPVQDLIGDFVKTEPLTPVEVLDEVQNNILSRERAQPARDAFAGFLKQKANEMYPDAPSSDAALAAYKLRFGNKAASAPNNLDLYYQFLQTPEGIQYRAQYNLPSPDEVAARHDAASQWLQSQFANYINEKVGTPNEPAAKLASQGFTFAKPEDVLESSQFSTQNLEAKRIQAGMPPVTAIDLARNEASQKLSDLTVASSIAERNKREQQAAALEQGYGAVDPNTGLVAEGMNLGRYEPFAQASREAAKAATALAKQQQKYENLNLGAAYERATDVAIGAPTAKGLKESLDYREQQFYPSLLRTPDDERVYTVSVNQLKNLGFDDLAKSFYNDVMSGTIPLDKVPKMTVENYIRQVAEKRIGDEKLAKAKIIEYKNNIDNKFLDTANKYIPLDKTYRNVGALEITNKKFNPDEVSKLVSEDTIALDVCIGEGGSAVDTPNYWHPGTGNRQYEPIYDILTGERNPKATNPRMTYINAVKKGDQMISFRDLATGVPAAIFQFEKVSPNKYQIGFASGRGNQFVQPQYVEGIKDYLNSRSDQIVSTSSNLERNLGVYDRERVNSSTLAQAANVTTSEFRSFDVSSLPRFVTKTDLQDFVANLPSNAPQQAAVPAVADQRPSRSLESFVTSSVSGAFDNVLEAQRRLFEEEEISDRFQRSEDTFADIRAQFNERMRDYDPVTALDMTIQELMTLEGQYGNSARPSYQIISQGIIDLMQTLDQTAEYARLRVAADAVQTPHAVGQNGRVQYLRMAHDAFMDTERLMGEEVANVMRAEVRRIIEQEGFDPQTDTDRFITSLRVAADDADLGTVEIALSDLADRMERAYMQDWEPDVAHAANAPAQQPAAPANIERIRDYLSEQTSQIYSEMGRDGVAGLTPAVSGVLTPLMNSYVYNDRFLSIPTERLQAMLGELGQQIELLEMQGEYERAAASRLSDFHNAIEYALRDLQQPAAPAANVQHGDLMPNMSADELLVQYRDRLSFDQIDWLREFGERWEGEEGNTDAGREGLTDEYARWRNANRLASDLNAPAPQAPVQPFDFPRLVNSFANDIATNFGPVIADRFDTITQRVAERTNPRLDPEGYVRGLRAVNFALEHEAVTEGLRLLALAIEAEPALAQQPQNIVPRGNDIDPEELRDAFLSGARVRLDDRNYEIVRDHVQGIGQYINSRDEPEEFASMVRQAADMVLDENARDLLQSYANQIENLYGPPTRAAEEFIPATQDQMQGIGQAIDNVLNRQLQRLRDSGNNGAADIFVATYPILLRENNLDGMLIEEGDPANFGRALQGFSDDLTAQLPNLRTGGDQHRAAALAMENVIETISNFLPYLRNEPVVQPAQPAPAPPPAVTLSRNIDPATATFINDYIANARTVLGEDVVASVLRRINQTAAYADARNDPAGFAIGLQLAADEAMLPIVATALNELADHFAHRAPPSAADLANQRNERLTEAENALNDPELNPEDLNSIARAMEGNINPYWNALAADERRVLSQRLRQRANYIEFSPADFAIRLSNEAGMDIPDLSDTVQALNDGTFDHEILRGLPEVERGRAAQRTALNLNHILQGMQADAQLRALNPNGVPPAPAPRAITRQQQRMIERVPQITDMLIEFSQDDPITTAADYRRIANILRDRRNAREFLEEVMGVGDSLGDFTLRASDLRANTLSLVADELESRAANMAVPGGPLMTDNELYNNFTDIIRAAIRDEDFEPANYSNADLAMLVADDQIGGLDDLTPEQRARLAMIVRDRGFEDDDYANGGPVRGYKKGGSVEADEQAAFGIYPSAGKRRQKSDIGDKLNASLVPQDALDLALTIAPFGKAGKALATAILAGAPTEAQAGNMSSLLKLVAREAPEQFQSIREALLRTFNTGLEHSVIGSTRTGGPSQVVQGKEISVIPSKADIAKAKQNLGQSGLIDFHTHPNAANLGLLEPEFRIRPSDADLQYWMSNYGGRRTATTPSEIKTMIGTPPNRQEGVTSSYNFFATDKPNQTLDRRAYDAARYELQRSKPLQALKDNPVVGQYLDAGGTFGDVIGSASPMLLQKFYAQKGLGRHDMRLSNAPTSAPTVTESNLFNEIVNPAMEILESKKFGSFADGGIVQQNPTTDQMRYELMMRRK